MKRRELNALLASAEITKRELAAEIGISPSYLSRVLKQYEDEIPERYMLRIERALRKIQTVRALEPKRKSRPEGAEP